METQSFVEATTQIAKAYFSNNSVPHEEVPIVIGLIHGALSSAYEMKGEPKPEPLAPAVAIKKSIKPNAITCLGCGKKFKSLKRHIAADHDMTAEEYRKKWGLAIDYPMVAPVYSAQRTAIAKMQGLGLRSAKRRR